MEFLDRLEKFKDSIIAAAKGRTCTDCDFAIFDCGKIGYCRNNANYHILHGGPITISQWAPICKRYKQKT